MFTDKVVLITGASSGIGAACALAFAKSSATLSLVGRNIDNLSKIGKLCEKLNHLKPILIVADLTLDTDLDKIVEETVNKFGKINVLINNAGINSVPETHSSAETYDQVMATNLRATYLLTTKATPYLLKTKGNVVNVSSILSNKPLPIMTPYCMSKAAIDMMTKCTALQLGPRGVRVNAVNPGPVKTEMFRRGGMTDINCDRMFIGIEMTAPLKKVTKGEDVAELVMFLASDKATCITGSCYVIDCGLMLGEAGNL